MSIIWILIGFGLLWMGWINLKRSMANNDQKWIAINGGCIGMIGITVLRDIFSVLVG